VTFHLVANINNERIFAAELTNARAHQEEKKLQAFKYWIMETKFNEAELGPSDARPNDAQLLAVT